MEATLEVTKRDGRGKNEARRLRAGGQIPAVVYGGQKEGAPVGTPVSVNPKDLLRILHSASGANTLITLKFDGTDSRVMVREYQLDPVTHHLLHADFYALAMDKAITVKVQIVLTGTPAGVKLQGGVVDFVTRDIEVESLPNEIPANVTIDISDLALNQAVRVRDLPENPKWKPVSEPELMIVHVVMPRVEEVAAAPADAVATTAAEPEVIKKGKTDKEEEAPAKEKK